MAKLTVAEKNIAVKEYAVNAIQDSLNVILENDDLVQTGDYTYAIRCEVDGEERWAEVSVVAKNNKATKTTDAFDPYEKAEEWQAEKSDKAREKAEKDKKKAEKIAKSKAKTKENKEEIAEEVTEETAE